MPTVLAGSARPLSLWLEQALSADPVEYPALHGDLRTDVLIVGGGYVGLWTAIELKALDPGLSVTVIEQDVCGSGASGRNGGYVLSWWPKAASFEAKWGRDTAAHMLGLSETVIGELEAFCTTEAIPAQFIRSGWLWGAACQAHEGVWNGAVEICQRLGVGSFRELDSGAAQQLSGGGAFLSAILDKTAALLHPGHLARGLRRVAKERGIAVFERTGLSGFSRTSPVVVRTDAGATIIAQKLVIATNAWAAGIPELSRSIAVVSSDIIASRPLPDRLSGNGWLNGAGVNDSRQMVNYVRNTVDGHILAGKGGLSSALGGSVGLRMFNSAGRAERVHSEFERLYPGFKDVEMLRSWSGPVDRSFDGMPQVGAFQGHPNILYGIGWSGNGLGPSRIGARILARLALDRRDEYTELPIVGPPRRDLPPEPIRFIGSHLVRKGVDAKDSAEMDGRKPSWLARQFASLAPRGVEDH